MSVFIAKETGTLTLDGEQCEVRARVTRVRAGHPLLALYPDLFEPVDDRVDYEWETADAPKRTRKTPAKDEPKRDPRRAEE